MEVAEPIHSFISFHPRAAQEGKVRQSKATIDRHETVCLELRSTQDGLIARAFPFRVHFLLGAAS